MSLYKPWIEVAKLRISIMQWVTVAMGYLLARPDPFHAVTLLHLLIGTFCVSAGAGMLNNWWEPHSDALMDRTKNRPIPTQQLRPGAVLTVGLIASLLGSGYLWVFCNPLTGIVAFLTVLTYILVYTPLKKIHWLNTYAGGIPGALPAIGGWAAATQNISHGAWALFLILFFWQIPHFLSLAWIYRDDYALANIKMLPNCDPSGRKTRLHMAFTMGCLGISLLIPVYIHLMSAIYLVFAMIFYLYFLKQVFVFLNDATIQTAKKAFRASIFFLPLLFIAILADILVFH